MSILFSFSHFVTYRFQRACVYTLYNTNNMLKRAIQQKHIFHWMKWWNRNWFTFLCSEIQYCIDNVHFVDILHDVRNNGTLLHSFVHTIILTHRDTYTRAEQSAFSKFCLRSRNRERERERSIFSDYANIQIQILWTSISNSIYEIMVCDVHLKSRRLCREKQ